MNSQSNPLADGVIQPTQARGSATQAKLVTATLDLLRTHSFESLSVAEITTTAGVATGTFYRRFTSKEAMLPLLYEAYDRLYARWGESLLSDARFESPDLRIRLAALISATATFYTDNRGLIRALHLNSRLTPTIVTDASTPQRVAQYHAIEALLIADVPAPKARRRIARQIALIMVSTLNEAILYPDCTPSVASQLSLKAVEQGLADAALGLVRAG